mmetsp:Transcript_37635/g.82017  ORF Transcript_37635/g.82017 Transcript_37635/m.82017 type:complete len:165 (+) Transcript_37635:242-736(+)
MNYFGTNKSFLLAGIAAAVVAILLSDHHVQAEQLRTSPSVAANTDAGHSGATKVDVDSVYEDIVDIVADARSLETEEATDADRELGGRRGKGRRRRRHRGKGKGKGKGRGSRHSSSSSGSRSSSSRSGKGKGKGKGGKGRGKARGKSGKGKGGSKRQLRGDMIA